MDAEFDPDNLPKCPDCNVGMSYYTPSMNHDLETMGGHSIQHLECDICKEKYTLINTTKLYCGGED